MIPVIILIGALAMAASAPTDPLYTINVDGPEGRHVQMGEPGKAVSGYFTSRSLDGLMEYKTMYEADDKGFRVRGDHLPSSTLPDPKARSGEAPSYIFNYDAAGSHSHYQMGEAGKAVQGSFMYYDAQGRSQRVDYEADENGYRVKPAEPKPEISTGTDAVVVKAAEPAPVAEVVPVAAEPVVAAEVAAEPAPAAEPVAAAVVVARGRPNEVYFNMYQIERAADLTDESVPTVVAAEPVVAVEEPIVAAEPVVVAEPVPETAVVPAADPVPVAVAVKVEPVVETEVKPQSDSPAVQPKFVAVSVPHPGFAYFRGSLPYAQPAFHYSPYPYSYGFGYPFSGGNYFYTI